jgi:hypothetical protein
MAACATDYRSQWAVTRETRERGGDHSFVTNIAWKGNEPVTFRGPPSPAEAPHGKSSCRKFYRNRGSDTA